MLRKFVTHWRSNVWVNTDTSDFLKIRFFFSKGDPTILRTAGCRPTYKRFGRILLPTLVLQLFFNYCKWSIYAQLIPINYYPHRYFTFAWFIIIIISPTFTISSKNVSLVIWTNKTFASVEQVFIAQRNRYGVFIIFFFWFLFLIDQII